uniref:Uncharacterized protein n=1 Tax=Kalanchoe fedtschenkoi TaxID=63787 RepID=A0A7N0ZRT3_KALFE
MPFTGYAFGDVVLHPLLPLLCQPSSSSFSFSHLNSLHLHLYLGTLFKCIFMPRNKGSERLSKNERNKFI